MSNLKTSMTDNPKMVIGSLALLAGITVPGQANATLILNDIGETVDDGYFTLDIDGDNQDDIFFREGDDNRELGWIQPWNDQKVEFALQKSGFKGNLIRFNAGDSIDSASADYWYNYGKMYQSNSDGLLEGSWANVGATGFIGYRKYNFSDGGYNYGFIEMTHGSIVLGTSGYQTTTNAAAMVQSLPTTSVSEPGALLLMLTGAAGMAAQRRRRKLNA